ncbi:MAG: flagellar basal body-associated FliL family protein [Thermoanaerobacteraceae bacterium]|nr:flagellar basal body-associated FliL family protein [Thermoanaerobacteraceae bacterium]
MRRQEQKAEQTETGKKGGHMKRILIWGLLVVLLLASAVGATYYIATGKNGDGSKKDKPENIYKFELMPFTVNLADMGYRRFLRVQITLEYTNKSLGRELEEKRHRIRDEIINILRSKRVSDLDSLEKTTRLRQELLTGINQLLSDKIQGIYFKDFIIQ